MKRILLTITLLTLLLPAFRPVEAGVEVSVDLFYDNLGSDGSWVELEDYGYCWQPSVAMSNSHWRPYADGYWAFTDVGWTWVSNEDFGWATYHYGRWARLHGRGWFWVPGREWGPAWVSWRTGGDYVGWAPLPPRGGGEVVYDSSPINGQVDVEFDIGPDYYNFVDVRYIGEPVLQDRIFEPRLNITYIAQTVNVTNITYVNSTVYNHGPDYDRLSQYSTRPIRRMTLERDANTDLSAAVTSRGLTRVEGDKLIVAAPLTIQKSPSAIGPKNVKEKIAKPKFEHGWDGVSDPKAQADLRQKMKSEDSKTVPPPSIKPHDKSQTAVPPMPVSPEQGKGVSKDTHPEVAPAVPRQSPPLEQIAPDVRPKQPLPSERVVPSKQAAPPEVRPNQPLPSEQVAPPKLDARPGVRPKQALPPERVAPPKADVRPNQPLPSEQVAPPDIRPKRPLPPERVSPKMEALPDVQPKQQPLPPQRVTPQKLDAPRPLPPDHAAPPRLEAPPRVMPPKRELPPVPHQQPPPQRLAPPPRPAADGPRQPDSPRGDRPPGKKAPAPTPGS